MFPPGSSRLTVTRLTTASLRLAVTLLTAIPLPHREAGGPPSRQAAGGAMIWAPVIGLLLGGIAAGVLYVFQRFWHAGPLLGATLAIIVLAALSGCLHLDGLADFADGLGSRKPAGQALAIMRRSDIGPFGVAALVLTLLLQVTALSQADALGRGVTSVIAAAITGRLALTWACRRGVPAARSDGLGALVAGTVHPAIPVILSVAALAGGAAFGLIFVVAVAAGLAASLAVTWLAVRRLGGITGDVLGAVVEIATAVCLVVLALS
jgi:adenosylcobinamide-GDP ribazoletransferase